VVKLDGADRYFDPGTPQTPFGLISWENTAAAGLLVKDRKNWEWVHTPSPEIAETLITRTADLRLEDGVVKGTATMTWRGHRALSRRLDVLNEDESESRKGLEEDVKSMLAPGSSVKLVSLENLKNGDQPLTATFEVELPSLATFAGSKTVIPLSLFESASRNPFSAEQRKVPVYYPYQHQVEDRITFDVPAGMAVQSHPAPINLDFGALGYFTRFVVEGQKLTFERKLKIDTLIIPAAQYKAVRKFYGDVVAADHDGIVLKKGA
jgi:hypothetical protein